MSLYFVFVFIFYKLIQKKRKKKSFTLGTGNIGDWNFGEVIEGTLIRFFKNDFSV